MRLMTKGNCLVHLGVLAALGAGGCNGSQIASTTSDGDQIVPLVDLETMTNGITSTNGICSRSTAVDSPTSPEYSIAKTSATISGDLLTVQVSAEDPCTSDTYYACWSDLFEYQLPPETRVYIVRLPGTSCIGRPLDQMVTIDLEPIRASYIKLWGANDNSVKMGPRTIEGGIQLDIFNPSTEGGGLSLNYSWPYPGTDGGLD